MQASFRMSVRRRPAKPAGQADPRAETAPHKSGQPLGTRPETQFMVRRAAALKAKGVSWQRIAMMLGQSVRTVQKWPIVYAELWNGQGVRPVAPSDAAADHTAARPNRGGRPPQRVKRAAQLIAAGSTWEQAAEELGVSLPELRAWPQRHVKIWDRAYAAASEHFAKRDLELFDKTRSDHIRARIKQIVNQRIAGKTWRQIGEQLNLHPNYVDQHRVEYPGIWNEEYESSMGLMTQILREKLARPAKPEDDIDEACRQMSEYLRWAKAKSLPTNPNHVDGVVTLSDFFKKYYKPTCLATAAPANLVCYEETLTWWIAITGDPPIDKISSQTIANFYACLGKRRGKKQGSVASPNSVRRHARSIQAVIDRLGPAMPRCRDAAGILTGLPPYAKPPRPVVRLPKRVSDHDIDATYEAAERAPVPCIGKIRPADWWRALIVFMYNTALRLGSVLSLRTTDVLWKENILRMPPGKTRIEQELFLNSTVMAHLNRIKGPRELLFEWPHDRTHLRTVFYRMQTSAMVPDERRFTFHALRRTAATVLAKQSPAAAQLALGHSSGETTSRHYLDRELLFQAMERMPQPKAFLGAASNTSDVAKADGGKEGTP